MKNYYVSEMLTNSKLQRKKVLITYFILLGLYLAFSIGILCWYLTLTYKSPDILKLKLIHYPVTGIFVIFSAIYLGVIYKRVNKFYKMCFNLKTGLKETFEAKFIRFDENLCAKDGVDCKLLIFKEWNKYKKEHYERKVYVFYEYPFPEIPVGATVEFITQGNVLVSYKIKNKVEEVQWKQ